MGEEKANMIIAATSEIENNEYLARVVGEGIREIAKRGRGAWEELFQMLASIGEEKEEVVSFLEEFVEGEKP